MSKYYRCVYKAVQVECKPLECRFPGIDETRCRWRVRVLSMEVD